MNLQYINFLTQLKNNAAIEATTIRFSFNVRLLPLIKFLYSEGIIESFSVKKNFLFIQLRLFNGSNPFKDLRIVSTISYEKFLTYNEISKITESKFLFILSTDKGFLNLSECKQRRIGGLLLFIF